MFNLVRGLDRKHFAPMVVLPSRGPLFDKLKILGVDIEIIPLREFSRKKIFAFLFSTLKLANLIKKEKIDLVHANSIYIVEQSYFAAKLRGVPIICHVRDLVPVLGAGKIRRKAFNGAEILIAISEAVKKDLIEKLHIPQEKITRIYNGVDTNEFSPDVSGEKFLSEFNLGAKKLVGMIGRFSPEKGQEVFLNAAAEVLKKYNDVNFVIIGDAKLGSEKFKEKMINLSVKLGLTDKVIFTGFRDDLPQVLASLDVLVVPSVREPFGRVIIEAMAMEKPVVAFNSGAPEEILNYESRFLITPGDVSALTDGILTLLRDEKLRKETGIKARKVVIERFGIARHIFEVEALYTELLKE